MVKKELVELRKIIGIAEDLGITLPRDWVKKNKIKKGDTLLIRAEVIDKELLLKKMIKK